MAASSRLPHGFPRVLHTGTCPFLAVLHMLHRSARACAPRVRAVRARSSLRAARALARNTHSPPTPALLDSTHSMSDAAEATRTYPWYKVELAKSGRARCRESLELIKKGELRIAKMGPNAFDDEGADMPAWYLPAPFFNMLKRARVNKDIEIDSIADLDAMDAANIASFAALHAEHKAWLALPISERPKPKRKTAKEKTVFVPAPSKKKKAAAVMRPTADEAEALIVRTAAFFTALGKAERANPIKLRVLFAKHAGKERALLQKIATNNGSSAPVEDATTRASECFKITVTFHANPQLTL